METARSRSRSRSHKRSWYRIHGPTVQRSQSEDGPDNTAESQVKFMPGALGIQLDYDSGQIIATFSSGQAAKQGVQRGWFFKTIGGAPYSHKTLQKKMTGVDAYDVTFGVLSEPNQAEMIEVTVTSLVGKSLEFMVTAEDTVATLREQVALAWDLASPGQVVLMIGTCVVGNGKQIAQCSSRAFTAAVRIWSVMKALSCSLSENDSTMRLWDLDAGRCLNLFQNTNGAITCMAADFSLGRAVCGSETGDFSIWNLETGALLGFMYRPLFTPRNGKCFIADFIVGEALSGTNSGLLVHWSMADGSQLGNIFLHHRIDANCVVADLATKDALVGCVNGELHLFRAIGKAKTPSNIFTTNSMLYCLSADFTAMEALSIHVDRSLRHWDLTQKVCLHTFKGLTVGMYVCAADFFTMTAVTGSSDGKLTCWDLETGLITQSIDCHRDVFINCITVDFDAERAITGASDCKLKLWNLRTGECLRTLDGHSGPVQLMAAGVY